MIKGYKPVRVLKRGGKSLLVTLMQNDDGDKIIKKQYNPKIQTHKDSFEKEVRVLTGLESYPYTPKLLCVDRKNYTFYETYCGKQVPNDSYHYDKMVERTKDLYEKFGLAYIVDGKQEWFVHRFNYCLMNDEIYAIDFGSIKWRGSFADEHYDNHSSYSVDNSVHNKSVCDKPYGEFNDQQKKYKKYKEHKKHKKNKTDKQHKSKNNKLVVIKRK